MKNIWQIIMMSSHLMLLVFLQASFGSILYANSSYGQSQKLDEVDVSLEMENVRLKKVFGAISNQTDFKFSYNNQLVNDQEKLSMSFEDASLYEVLVFLAKERKLKFKRIDDNIHVNLVDNGSPQAPIVETLQPLQPLQVRISGKVTDSEDGEPLPGVSILIKGSSTGTTTNMNGNYTLNAAEGDVLQFSYIGYEKYETTVSSTSDTLGLELNVQLKPSDQMLSEVVVSGQLQGQMNAIRDQLNSNTIVSIVSKDRIEELPDQNAAESVGRLPGVAIQRDAGEGQKVVLRGLSPRFNAITINGERIPSTDPSNRSVDLSLIAPEQLEGIEVFKSLIPSQDGDAIGGTVNFIVKKAPKNFNATVRAQTGYNGIAEEFGQNRANFSVSNRFVNNKLGVLFTGNFQNANRSADILESSWGTPISPERIDLLQFRLSDNIEERLRYGGSLGLDYDFNDNHSIFYNLFWGETTRDRVRRRRTLDIENNLQGYDIDRVELQTRVISHSLSGDHKVLNEKYTVNWRTSYSTSSQKTPFSHRLRFREIDAFQIPTGGFPAGAQPNEIIGFANNNLENAFLRRGQLNQDETTETVYTASVDLERRFALSEKSKLTLKAGVKLRVFDRVKDAVQFRDNGNGPQNGFQDFLDVFPNEYTTLANNSQLIAISNFLGNFTDDNFLEGDIDFGPGLSIAQADRFEQFFASQFYFRNDLIDNEDYDAVERIPATYAMGQLDIGRLMVLAGARMEHTDADYIGFITAQVDDDNLEEGEAGVAFRQQQESNIAYTEILPMVHLRYRFTDWFDVRAAVTKSLARPDFQNLVPFANINAFESFATLGNPALQHMTAWNYDLFLSFYKPKYGLFTIGGFYKVLDNIDVEFNFIDTDRRSSLFGFNVTQPINAESTTIVRGIEFDLQTNLSSLPSPFDGIVLSANLTLIDSETFYPSFERRGDTGPPLFTPFFESTEREGNLPGQPDVTANLSLGYEKGGFSGRFSMLLQDNSFQTLGNRAEFDSFTKLLVRWDASMSQKISERFQVFLNWNNISNAAEIDFQFEEQFETRREFFGFTADLGIRFRL